ncbi:MAG: helix-turn-helix domain-containing protein [Acidilobaceae archaeon]
MISFLIVGILLLKPKEVCERLGISYTTLRDYVRRRWIKPVILESGKWRFREEDVEKLMGVVKPEDCYTLRSCLLANAEK